MKIGEYIQPKESFSRTIFSITKNTQTGEITDVIVQNKINFLQYKKYLITNIFTLFDTELVEIDADNIKLCFKLSNNTTEYEYVHDLFTIDLSAKRAEKLKQLNKIQKKNRLKNLFSFLYNLGPR